MGDGDEGARLSRSLRQPWRALVRFGVGKIERQPGCDDVPVFAGGGRQGVNFGANQGCEIAGAQLAGVGEMATEAVQEMIGHLQEIIACAFIGLDDVNRVQGAMKGPVRVTVKLPSTETAPVSKRGESAWE